MSQLHGLRNIGLELNPLYLGDWPYRVGQYMLNFGGIELLSYRVLLLLEGTREQFNKNLDLPWDTESHASSNYWSRQDSRL